MRPDDGQVLHFSEDPTITVFAPHVARTARQAEAYVWAVDAIRAPDYWFPRQCPRALAWTTPRTTTADAERILGPGGGDRVHAVEYGWLERIRTTRLFAYRLPAESFAPFGDPEPHAHVSSRAIRPLGPPEPVGDLFAPQRRRRDPAAGPVAPARVLDRRRRQHARVQRYPPR